MKRKKNCSRICAMELAFCTISDVHSCHKKFGNTGKLKFLMAQLDGITVFHCDEAAQAK